MGWGGLEGYGSQEEAPDSAREFREGFLEEEMFEFAVRGQQELIRRGKEEGSRQRGVWKAPRVK